MFKHVLLFKFIDPEVCAPVVGEKLQNAIELYARIEDWYSDYLTTSEARNAIDTFDRLLPDYAWVSDTKKIDCLLWSKRG